MVWNLISFAYWTSEKWAVSHDIFDDDGDHYFDSYRLCIRDQKGNNEKITKRHKNRRLSSLLRLDDKIWRIFNWIKCDRFVDTYHRWWVLHRYCLEVSPYQTEVHCTMPCWCSLASNFPLLCIYWWSYTFNKLRQSIFLLSNNCCCSWRVLRS